MRKALYAVVLVWLCLFACAFAMGEGVSRVLLVGCDRFVNYQDTASAAANSVTMLSRVMVGGGLNTVRLISRRSGVSGKDELAELIGEAFDGADEGDLSYFYISTHGLWERGWDNADMKLVLSDGRTEELLSARELRSLLDRVPGTKVLMLDACHSGAAIGKGVPDSFANIFTGGDYIIITSAGGMEESWLWASGAGQSVGGYFSGATADGISAIGGYAADTNRDGIITLSELKLYLRTYDGASTVQTYPEESDFAVMTYEVSSFSGRRTVAQLDDLVFGDCLLTVDEPAVNFAFTVLQDTQLAYRVVPGTETGWDFDSASVLRDPGDANGVLIPGYHERSIRLQDDSADDSGYLLLELVTISNAPRLAASCLVCVASNETEPELSVATESFVLPENGDELGILVMHGVPCQLTVTVENEAGETVCRLASARQTRPEQIPGGGSTFFWGGTAADGELAEAGNYRIRVRTRVNGKTISAVSELFRVVRTETVTPRIVNK